MANRTPESVIRKMKKNGRTLHLTNRWYGPEWRLSDSTVVDPEVARIVTKSKSVASVGDSLFAGTLAQTWRFVRLETETREEAKHGRNSKNTCYRD